MDNTAEKEGQPQIVCDDAFVSVTPLFSVNALRNITSGTTLLIQIKNLAKSYTFPVRFADSVDKEGFAQLYPFFYTAEELRLYKASINGIGISDMKKFDFERADLDWVKGTATIMMHLHGDDLHSTIKMHLRRTLDTFSLEQESIKSERRIL